MSGPKTGALPDISARFRAEYLHALEPILKTVDPCWDGIGLIIEPAETGVLVVATNGRTLGVFHDVTGQANRPFRAILPRSFRKRCAPATIEKMFEAGPADWLLPEWAQPGCVCLTPFGAMLMAKMPAPDQRFGMVLESVPLTTGNHWRETDYRVETGKIVDWRKPIETFAPAPMPHLFFDPVVYAEFRGVVRMARNREGTPHVILTPGGTGKTMLVQVPTLPHFIGAVMPQPACDVPDVPGFIARVTEKTTPKASATVLPFPSGAA